MCISDLLEATGPSSGFSDGGYHPPLATLGAQRAFAAASWRRIAWQYGLAIVAIAVGVAIKLAFDSVLRGEASYVLFVPAVLIASALGGWGPGLPATALGLALGLFLLQRPASWQQPTS